jgi:hypothetical protein
MVYQEPPPRRATPTDCYRSIEVDYNFTKERKVMHEWVQAARSPGVRQGCHSFSISQAALETGMWNANDLVDFMSMRCGVAIKTVGHSSTARGWNVRRSCNMEVLGLGS